MFCITIYTVTPGDSVFSISRRYGIEPQKIIETNFLKNPEQIIIGEDLILSTDHMYYTVKEGDSLYTISVDQRIDLDKLICENPKIQEPYLIRPGQTINIPYDVIREEEIEVNGYAYPNISKNTLQTILPELTYLSIFSCSILANGNIESIDDRELVNLALQANVAPIMVVTNIGESGNFSTPLVDALLSNQEAQSALINNIIVRSKTLGYRGVNVDFEYISPSQKQNYNTFLKRLSEQLHNNELILITSIAPKTSATQRGTLYEAHDYSFHNTVADRVIIMTYEWGYTYGPPMAIAPINEVRKVLNYAVSEISPQKILMGMPNYAYDWELPYQQGRAAQTMSLNQAFNLAKEKGSQIKYSETAQAPFFEYYDSSGNKHVVWFDKALSINARLRLIEEYNLAGVSYWTVNNLYMPNWLVLNSMYNIKKD